MTEIDPSQRLEKLRLSTIGLDTEYTLADGSCRRRIYLDSTASTLALGITREILEAYLPYYANTHTDAHFGAKLSNREYNWAHQRVLDFCRANPEQYTSFFIGSGATAGINRIARTRSAARPDRDVVITSIMEHHSNDLPHRANFKQVIHVPTRIRGNALGCVDLDRIESALGEYRGRVNYIAVTGVSNVTGIINPIYEVAELAHRYDTEILVDAAQMAAHVPIQVSNPTHPQCNLDMVVMSGHKIYTPGSPGVVVTRKDLFTAIDPVELGGGMVDDVHLNYYQATENFPDREEAGTPNITGAISLAAVLQALDDVGMETIDREEQALVNYAVERLVDLPDIIIYGDTDVSKCRRTGAISFNIREMDHALTATILNDYFNISVRNACFCAHPYVREMVTEDVMEIADDLDNEQLEKLMDLYRGMVRASFGLYNTREDIDELCKALETICNRRAEFEAKYDPVGEQEYQHREFNFDSTAYFAVQSVVDKLLQ